AAIVGDIGIEAFVTDVTEEFGGERDEQVVVAGHGEDGAQVDDVQRAMIRVSLAIGFMADAQVGAELPGFGELEIGSVLHVVEELGLVTGVEEEGGGCVTEIPEGSLGVAEVESFESGILGSQGTGGGEDAIADAEL